MRSIWRRSSNNRGEGDRSTQQSIFKSVQLQGNGISNNLPRAKTGPSLHTTSSSQDIPVKFRASSRSSIPSSGTNRKCCGACNRVNGNHLSEFNYRLSKLCRKERSTPNLLCTAMAYVSRARRQGKEVEWNRENHARSAKIARNHREIS